MPDRPDVARAGALVCEVVDAPIGPADWAAYFPGVDYRPPCPG